MTQTTSSTDVRCSPAAALDATALQELATGLSAAHASIAPKFLYDALGSKLFEAICELPEYYPTRTEAAIIERHGSELAAAIGICGTFIDLGAGNCAKAARLFSQLTPHQYVAIDISSHFVHDAVENLRNRFPDIDMRAVGLDFSRSLDLPQFVAPDKRLFFYPGSSIGNFSPSQARAFLERVRAQCGADGGLLIGIDLVKDQAVLDAAYDDALGVTAAFNLNVLRHVNALIGANFDVRQWCHRGFYNRELGRVEMHLEARDDVTVRWHGDARQFVAGETIHTENSYKYRQGAAVDLLEGCGFEVARIWTDPNEWFALIYARPLAGIASL